MKNLDLLIIGSGQGSHVLAEAMAKEGWKVGVAERKDAGGSCVNFGCTPTKAVLASAKVAYNAGRAADFGIEISSVRPNFAEVMRQARDLVAHSRGSVERSLSDWLIRGHATILGQDEAGFRVRIGEEEVTAKHVVLNTGTRTLLPKIDGLDAVPCLDSANWIHGETLPKSLAIVGGGYIAVEMGQFYRRMGAEVTIIDRGPQPLVREDEDVSKLIHACLEREGIRFLLETEFEKVVREGDGWRLTCTCADGPTDVIAEAIFIASGRKPNTDDLGLQELGVEMDDKGMVKVDEYLRTNVPNLLAIGDIRGGPMFTHTAWDDGRIASEVLLGKPKRSTHRVVPYAVFTHPEVARVGLSEREATEKGIRYRVGKAEMKHNAHAQEKREMDGFVKVLIEEETDKLLGASIVAEEAAEMIHLFTALLLSNSTCATLRDMLVVHPTYAESIQSAVL